MRKQGEIVTQSDTENLRVTQSLRELKWHSGEKMIFIKLSGIHYSQSSKIKILPLYSTSKGKVK